VPELSRMAFGVLQTAFMRLESLGRVELHEELGRVLHQFRNVDGGYVPEPVPVRIAERPPAATVPGYRPSAS